MSWAKWVDEDTIYYTANGREITAESFTGWTQVKTDYTIPNDVKVYFEINITTTETSNYIMVGVCQAADGLQNHPGSFTGGIGYHGNDGNKFRSNSGTAYGDSYGVSRIGIAVDKVNDKIYFRKDGVWQNSGDPVAGTGFAFDSIEDDLIFSFSTYYGGGVAVLCSDPKDITGSVPTGFTAGLGTNPFDISSVDDANKLHLTLDSSLVSSNQTDFPLTIHLDGTDPLHEAIFTELADGDLPTNAKLLIQSDHRDGSTDIVDTLGTHTITLGALAEHSTDQIKFGNSSLGFESSYQKRIIVSTSSDFDFSGDFWMEAWVYNTTFIASGSYICKRASSGVYSPFLFRMTTGGAIEVKLTTNGTSWGFSQTAGTMAVKTWHHIAVGRSGSTVYIFLDGVLEHSSTWVSTALWTNSDVLLIGSEAAAYAVNGWMNDVLIVKGSCLETATFTPRTRAYSTDYRKRLAITDANGTHLPIEIENWDQSGELAVLHTKVPTFPSSYDDQLILLYDSSQGDNSYIGNTVNLGSYIWDTNFGGIYHMSQDPSVESTLDSTVNTLDGVSSGTMLTADLVDCLVGQGLNFDGADDFINIGEAFDFAADDVAIECLVNRQGDTGRALFFGQSSASGTTATVSVLMEFDASNYINAYFGNGTTLYSVTGSTAITDSNWHYVVFKRDTNLFSIYVDDVLIDSDTQSITLASPAYDFSIGAGGEYSSARFGGDVDEVRVSLDARSTDWMSLTYASFEDSVITWSAFSGTVVSETGYQKPTSAFSGFSTPYKTTIIFNGFATKNKNLLPTYPTFGGS